MSDRISVCSGLRFLFAATLSGVTSERIHPPLIAAQIPNPETRRLAAELGAVDLAARAAAARALIVRGESVREAFPVLATALSDDEELDRVVASWVIYARPRPAADASALGAGLERDTKARAPAAWELSRIGPSLDAETVRMLVAALIHPDKHERNFVVVALATSVAPARDVVPGLLGVLCDPGVADPPQRNYKFPRATAAIALGLIGPAARECVPALAGILAEKGTWEFQRAANCFALGRIGPGATEALPALERARQDASPVVRAHAARAIDQISAPPAPAVKADVAALVQTLTTAPSRIDLKLVDGLRILGAFAGASAPGAKKGTRKTAPPVHESIALALGYLDSLPQSPRTDATIAFAAQEKSRGGSPDIRLYIMALGGVQQGIGPTLLEALVQGEDDPRVLAARRLASLGPEAGAAVPALRAALSDSDWILRREAQLALRRVEATGDDSHVRR